MIILFRSTDASFDFALQDRDINISSSDFAVSLVVYLRRTSVTVPFSVVVADGGDVVLDVVDVVVVVVVVVVVTDAVSIQSLIVIVLCISGRLIAGCCCHSCYEGSKNLLCFSEVPRLKFKKKRCWKSASIMYSTRNYGVIVELCREDHSFDLRTLIS